MLEYRRPNGEAEIVSVSKTKPVFGSSGTMDTLCCHWQPSWAVTLNALLAFAVAGRKDERIVKGRWCTEIWLHHQADLLKWCPGFRHATRPSYGGGGSGGIPPRPLSTPYCSRWSVEQQLPWCRSAIYSNRSSPIGTYLDSMCFCYSWRGGYEQARKVSWWLPFYLYSPVKGQHLYHSCLHT